jgi:hypothetical protein
MHISSSIQAVDSSQRSGQVTLASAHTLSFDSHRLRARLESNV